MIFRTKFVIILALKNLIKFKVNVVRNNKHYEIDSSNVVPGDILVLESGTQVSADARILSCNNLTIDESVLDNLDNTIQIDEEIVDSPLESEIVIENDIDVEISTDTRTIKEGDFYLPLKGASFDGENFIRS